MIYGSDQKTWYSNKWLLASKTEVESSLLFCHLEQGRIQVQQVSIVSTKYCSILRLNDAHNYGLWNKCFNTRL